MYIYKISIVIDRASCLIKNAANKMYNQVPSVSSIKETVTNMYDQDTVHSYITTAIKYACDTLNSIELPPKEQVLETLGTVVAVVCTKRVAKYSCVGALSGGLGLCTVIAIIPPLLGFAVGGIVGGSVAALLMAFHGGFTPAGGFVAFMQSTGTCGLYAGFNPVIFYIGSSIGLFAGAYLAITTSDDFVFQTMVKETLSYGKKLLIK